MDVGNGQEAGVKGVNQFLLVQLGHSLKHKGQEHRSFGRES